MTSRFFFCWSFLFLISCGQSPYGDTELYRDRALGEGFKITKPSSLVLPQSFVVAGEAAPSIDFNDLLTGADEDVQSYSCVFDRFLDDQVEDRATPCSAAPGTLTFDENTGVWNWVTDSAFPGAYEFKVMAVDFYERKTFEVFGLNVRPRYNIDSNLLHDFSSLFSLNFKNRSDQNSRNTMWTDLVSRRSAVLTGFNFDANSGWDSTDASLIYDGVGSFSDHGVLEDHSQFSFVTWLKPLEVNRPGAVVLGDYDESSLRGFELRQASDGSGRLEFKINFLSYSSAILQSEPLSYYKLNETSGALAIDSGAAEINGNYNSVDLGSTETPITSEPSVSANFDGTSSYVDLGNSPSHQMTGDQTIEFWIRPTAFVSRRNPIAKAYGGEGTMTLETNGRINYYYGTSGGNRGPYQGFGSVSPVVLNAWNHVTLVRNLSAGNLSWYINGNLTATASANFSAAVAGPNNLFIGRGYVNRIAGQMAHVAFYDKALTEADIQRHYQAATTSSCISSSALSNGTWTHVAALYDGSDYKLYINKSEECSLSRTYSPSDLPLVLGGLGGTHFWAGAVRSFRFYKTANLDLVQQD